ncbi:Udp-glycosyltransferase [Thalictrum thalictroides]|uniref:Udp-glycosyltransferase n=1 Tax=Thalictrum thalictroides TaxID=46969 RepID=A0A7J6WFS2_THATH|nr:Udp-glycosyltransferase [Thalictrum thalictroides]
MDDKSKLHVVMFPWLAIGHLIPFLELSKCLASKGHHVSFISTPRNIQRLPKLPQNLSPFITLVNLPFPQIQNLPENAQSSTDIPMKKTQLLKRAFDGLQVDFAKFLENSKIPIDWIIYDYASHWLPEIANKLDIPCVYFCLFTAATLCFYGPPYALLSSEEARMTPESYTIVPKWIPSSSDIVYRLHEILPNFEGFPDDISGISDVTGDVPDTYRFGVAIRDCLGYGRVPVLLPMLNDQGLNARLMVGKKLGIEIPRNEQDGSFTSESVAELLRMVMVEKEGEVLRSNARKMRGVFGDENVMGHYVDDFVGYLQAHKRQHGS